MRSAPLILGFADESISFGPCNVFFCKRNKSLLITKWILLAKHCLLILLMKEREKKKLKYLKAYGIYVTH